MISEQVVCIRCKMNDVSVPTEATHVVGFAQYTRPLENLWGSSANGRKCGCEWASRTAEDVQSTNTTITRTHARARSRSREVRASFVFTPHDETSRVAFRAVRSFVVVSAFFGVFCRMANGGTQHSQINTVMCVRRKQSGHRLQEKIKLRIEGDSGLALC